MRVTVVDLGVGNLPNAVRALVRVGAQVQVTGEAAQVRGASCLVLPGVGSAPAALRGLQERGLGPALQEAVASGAWLLGICLGHQLLFQELHEFGRHQGLGLLPGSVVALPASVRVPHMGWARVEARSGNFASLDGRWFYFVHSYAACPQEEDLLAVAEHQGHRFCAAVQRGRVVGVQFHPEKSGPSGQAFLREFLQRAA